MTRDLAVATRDTTLPEIALMMKQEDTGVIPVVEYDVQAGNGRSEGAERKYEGRNYTRGKLIGLITDRDIVVRAVADNKDCASVRAEDIMSVDIHTAKPNDRVVDVIRKMGDKQVRRIPVVNDNGYLVGMISMADVAIETRQDRELARRSRGDLEGFVVLERDLWLATWVIADWQLPIADYQNVKLAFGNWQSAIGHHSLLPFHLFSWLCETPIVSSR